MKTTYCHYSKGLTNQQYKTDKAHLDEFNPVECDWKELLRWLNSCAQKITYQEQQDIAHLWYNHVLTVLIEIVQKNVRDYKRTFIQGRGTVQQWDFTSDLSCKIINWINRLEYYIQENYKEGYRDTELRIQAALLIKKRLQDSLNKDQTQLSQTANQETYYDMINGLKEISKECNRYVEMIEYGGYMDGSLALLLVYIRNYCRVVEPFNRMIGSLADFYRNQVLQITPQAAVADKTYLLISPVDNVHEFTLPSNTAFNAGVTESGEELVYRTSQPETITNLRIEQIKSVLLRKNGNHTVGIYNQVVDFANSSIVTSLFADPDSETPSDAVYGWMIESSMLILDEGMRIVKIGFRLTKQSVFVLKTAQLENGFSVWLSHAQGWAMQSHTLRKETINDNTFLTFSLTMDQDALIPSACNQELHNISTQYPSIRILMDNSTCPYDWATQVWFNAVRIETEVCGIRKFSFYNELGQVETSQPFYPFGTQARQGAWFMFENREMGMKNLTSVSLKGRWKGLPANGYTELYKNYSCKVAVTDASFRVRTEYQKSGQWISCTQSTEQLFQSDGIKDEAEIRFKFNASEYSHERNCFFRVVLQEPDFGFGVDAYREQFASVMIFNSQHKAKAHKEIPSAPVIPMLSDVTLSYTACQTVELTKMECATTRLSHITPWSEYSIENQETQPLLPKVKDRQLYWCFSKATDVNFIQVYADLVFIKSDISKLETKIASSPMLTWEYLTKEGWASCVVKDETCGFTQNGFININLPETIHENLLWIRTCFDGDYSQCLAVRNVWLNCVLVTADGSDGSPLPAETIEQMLIEDDRVKMIWQPLSGFGGKRAQTMGETSARQSYRIAHRQRAVLPKDYESILIEQFPEIEKAVCVSFAGHDGALDVKVVVFCRTERNPYFITPSRKLTEMQCYLSEYASPFVPLQVINPVYSVVNIFCKGILKDELTEGDKERVSDQIVFIIKNYIASWIPRGTFPQMGQSYSVKGLHSRVANHQDIRILKELRFTYNGQTFIYQQSEDDFYIEMDYPWVVAIPGNIGVELLPPSCGIDEAEIGKDFRIG